LTPFARVLLDELDEGTVDFIPNYDGSQKEPTLLPARLPVMLLNGASGIAVGMATEIPPHNLREIAQASVALLKTPKLSDDELFDLVPGPDFAGGGQIISSPSDIRHVYSTGRGSVKARARWRFEEMARGQWQLVVYELPPNTSSQRVLEEIEDRTNPKVKPGKKSLTTEQQNTKALVLGMLDAVRDESGKDEAVRLVFEPKTSRIDRDEFVTMLLAQTGMEGSVSINLVCIGTDARPGQRSLRQILMDWLGFRTQTVTRRTQHRLDKVTDRIHVLEGRMVVYLNVDEVIQTIREADEPRPALMQRFDLSERQAEDILEMRLRQLARLEGFKIEKELADQKDQQNKLRELLDSPTALKRLIIKEIEADAKQYGDDRRTLIETAQRAVLETRVVDEPVTVIVSQKGWLRSRLGHGHDAAQFSFKVGDALYSAIECRSTDNLIALSNTGRVYTVAVSSLPSARGDGQPATSMVDVEPGSRIVHMIAGSDDQRYVLGTQSGYGFVTTLKDLSSRQKAGKQFVTLDKGDVLLKPLNLRQDDQHLVMLTRKGRFLMIALAELKVLTGGGRGTILMGLDSGDGIAQWAALNQDGMMASGVYRNKQTDIVVALPELAEYAGKRARKGKTLALKIKQPTIGAV